MHTDMQDHCISSAAGEVATVWRPQPGAVPDFNPFPHLCLSAFICGFTAWIRLIGGWSCVGGLRRVETMREPGQNEITAEVCGSSGTRQPLGAEPRPWDALAVPAVAGHGYSDCTVNWAGLLKMPGR